MTRRDGSDARPASWHRWFPAMALVAVALLQLALGHPVRARLTVCAALLIVVVIAVGVDVAGALGRFGHWLARVISFVAAALLFAVTILPAWFWTKLRRRSAVQGGEGWVPRHGMDTRSSSLGSSGTHALRPLWVRSSWAVGVVVLMLAVDFGSGWAWDRIHEEHPTTAGRSTARVDRTVPRDPRSDSPSLASAPWAADFFDEMGQTSGSYWPFTEYRPDPFRGDYLNIDGWDRRSYEPKLAAGAVTPTVWFMGSSTTFGEGQRDQHTIASEVARMAEAAEMPVRVRNYGQRGWVHFQEMLLYELLLADEPAPAFSVFIDGVNEVAGQVLASGTAPWQLLSKGYGAAFADLGSLSPSPSLPEADGSSTSDVWAAYAEHSTVRKVVRWIGTSSPAGAQEADDDAFERAETGRRALAVYERGRMMSIALSEHHGVDPLFVWQPFEAPVASIDYIRAHLSSPTIDIADALDGHEVDFIDGLHTNERGSRRVAAAIWKQLRPKVERWYAEH